LHRTAESKAALGGGSQLFVSDVGAANAAELQAAMRGCDALVIVTSATPKMKGPPKEGERPEFAYPAGGMPEQARAGA
jgi:hypothetical protein